MRCPHVTDEKTGHFKVSQTRSSRIHYSNSSLMPKATACIMMGELCPTLLVDKGGGRGGSCVPAWKEALKRGTRASTTTEQQQARGPPSSVSMEMQRPPDTLAVFQPEFSCEGCRNLQHPLVYVCLHPCMHLDSIYVLNLCINYSNTRN